MTSRTKKVFAIGFLSMIAGCGGAGDAPSIRVGAGRSSVAPRAWCTPSCETESENDFENALAARWIEQGWGTPPEPAPFSNAGENWVIFSVGADKAPAFADLVEAYAAVVPVYAGWYDVGLPSGGGQHVAIVYDPSNPPNYGHSSGSGGGYYE